MGQAVAFLPASMAGRQPRTDVVYRPVSDLSTVAVAWPGVDREGMAPRPRRGPMSFKAVSACPKK
jgi:hypothetical protein